ncbi:MAG: DUF2752 domain-containing protein [Thermoanaerobaculia bacterium]
MSGVMPGTGAPRAGARRQPQLGLLWGGVAASLVVLSPWAASWGTLLPPCALKSLFGVPCPACGTTRSAIALSRFDLPGAFSWNPLATAALMALVAGGLVAGVLAMRGREVPQPVRYPPWARGLAVALIAGNWLWLLAQGRV